MRTGLFLLFIFLCPLTWAQDCKELSVSGSDQWIPFAYASGEHPYKQAKGIAYDVVDQIGRDLGIAINLKLGIPWSRIEAMLENGDLDLLAGNYWNEDRAKKWLVTDHFALDDVRVFVRRDQSFPFQELKDLEGKRGLLPQGVSFGQDFDAYKKRLNIETVQLHEQMIRMLQLKRADYFILPFYSGVGKIRNLGFQEYIVPLETPVNVNTVHLSLSRRSPCAELLDEINQIIKQGRADGTFEAIFSKYR